MCSMEHIAVRSRTRWTLAIGAAFCVIAPGWMLMAAQPTPAMVTTVPLAAAVAPAATTSVPLAPTTVRVALVRARKRLELDLPFDGHVSDEAAEKIARLMRCPISGRT